MFTNLHLKLFHDIWAEKIPQNINAVQGFKIDLSLNVVWIRIYNLNIRRFTSKKQHIRGSEKYGERENERESEIYTEKVRFLAKLEEEDGRFPITIPLFILIENLTFVFLTGVHHWLGAKLQLYS